MKWAPLLLLLVPLSVVGRDDDPAAADRKKLQGDWIVSGQEVGGTKTDAKKIAKLKVTVVGDKVTARDDGEVVEQATYRLDVKSKPRRIDYTFTAGDDSGKTVRGIYKLEGDKLTVCMADIGGERPREFATKEGSGFTLFVYKRSRP